jgi:hypothetical protein
MNKFIIILVVLIIILYIRYNIKYSSVFEILQIQPSQLKLDILNEKNPIIIQNVSDDLNTLVKKSLKYIYLYTISCNHKINETDKVSSNLSRYMMIRNTSDKSFEIEIIHPKYKSKDDYKFVSVIIHPQNVLILPIFWKYKWVSAGVENKECVFVHDLFSSIYHTFSTIL